MSQRNFNTNLTKAEREKIGLTIKEWREAAGLSQTEAAFKIGISPTILRQIEKNRSDFRIDTLLVIACFFNYELIFNPKNQ